jgi:acetolactate synthase-1/2/3 large subunit
LQGLREFRITAERVADPHAGHRIIAWDLANPDFVKFAESFGAMGLRASTPEELRVALRKAFAADGPVVIEVPFDDLPDWRPLDRRYRMRG